MQAEDDNSSSGVIYAGSGWLGYLGPVPAVSAHCYPALGLYVSLGGGLRLAGGERVAALYVPPEAAVPAIRPEAGPVAVFFLAADNPWYLPLRRKLGSELRSDGLPAAELAAYLRTAVEARPAGTALVETVTELLDIGPAEMTDRRVRKVLDLLRDPAEQPPTLAALAAQVQLSPRRLQTLIQEHAGLRFRRFLLWQRLQQAADQIPRYASVTDIALAAGFADLAHLSRTFTALFGLSATAWARAAAPLSFRRVHCA